MSVSALPASKDGFYKRLNCLLTAEQASILNVPYKMNRRNLIVVTNETLGPIYGLELVRAVMKKNIGV